MTDKAAGNDVYRLRMAPSPTGYAHIGSARTALYNYLLAKHYGGEFIIRIEDTDRTRFVEDSISDIITSFKTLGIEWSEGPDIGGPYGPYMQSERLPIYHELLHKLIDEGKAYPCFCSVERLDALRKSQEAAKQPPGYDRLCRNIDPAEAKRRMETEPYVIRFKMPLSGQTVFEDLIHGTIIKDNAGEDDHILLKRKLPEDEYAWPTYHGCSPIDDHLMGITHIVRGDEWLASTHRHKLLFEAFGWDVPAFAHIPIILSPSGKGKMSKRDGATAIRDILGNGYLPEAFVNFLLLVGWAGPGEKELYTLEEAIEAFSFEGLSKSPAAYNQDKLNWFNGVYIRRLDPDDLAKRLVPFLAKAGLMSPDPDPGEFEYLMSIIPLIQERITTLGEVPEQINFLYHDADPYAPELLIPKKTSKEDTEAVLSRALDIARSASSFTSAVLHDECQKLAEELGLKVGQVFMPIRVAMSGRTVSPGSSTDIMAVLGRERAIARLETAVEKIRTIL